MKTLFNCSLYQKFVIPLFSLLLLFTHNAFADSMINVGPAIGTKAPIISVKNIQQQAVTIKEISRDKGLIILFFRSANWCPYCKRHLIELNNNANDFNDLGYGLAAISYDNTDILQKFSQQKSLNYPLLSDQQAKTVSAYNIMNKDYVQGDDNYGIPYPGVIVKGNVTHKRFFKGYKNRVKFSELYLALKNNH